MSEERYTLKFAACALASFICLAVSTWAWNTQGSQPAGSAFAGVVLNLGVMVLAIVASAIAFVAQEA